MRIALLTWGTRGDVQPYVALADELIRRGHHVRMCANVDSIDWVRRAGIDDVVPLPIDLRALFDTDRARAWLAAGKTPKFLRWVGEIEHEHRHAISAALWTACEGVDAVATAFFTGYRAQAIAEKLDVPLVRISPFPGPVTGEWPSPYFANHMPRVPFAFARRATHRMFLHVVDRAARCDVAELRRELGVRPLDAALIERDFEARVGSIGMWSETVLPRPRDWPANFNATGYCSLPPSIRARVGETVPAPLEEWLTAGSAPIFFGFGSMPVLDPTRLLDEVRQVTRRLGARALIGAGWTSYALDSDNDVFVAGAFDHDAVLPRCRAAVHHGGAGTTAAALRAGIPAVVCSVVADQPFWGWRISELGVGCTFPFQRLGAHRLEEALRRVLRSDVAARAKLIAERLRAEDGLGRTADAVEQALARAPQRPFAVQRFHTAGTCSSVFPGS